MAKLLTYAGQDIDPTAYIYIYIYAAGCLIDINQNSGAKNGPKNGNLSHFAKHRL